MSSENSRGRFRRARSGTVICKSCGADYAADEVDRLLESIPMYR